MTVAMTKIRADVLERTSGTESTTSSLISASEYMIADIVKEINPQDGHFLKYLPDQFLDSEQRAAKQTALKEDADRIAKLAKKQANNQEGKKSVRDDDTYLPYNRRAVVSEETLGLWMDDYAAGNRFILLPAEICDLMKGIKAKMIDASTLRSHTVKTAAGPCGFYASSFFSAGSSDFSGSSGPSSP